MHHVPFRQWIIFGGRFGRAVGYSMAVSHGFMPSGNWRDLLGGGYLAQRCAGLRVRLCAARRVGLWLDARGCRLLGGGGLAHQLCARRHATLSLCVVHAQTSRIASRLSLLVFFLGSLVNDELAGCS